MLVRFNGKPAGKPTIFRGVRLNGCGPKPCTPSEHQRWQMHVYPPPNGIAIGYATHGQIRSGAGSFGATGASAAAARGACGKRRKRSHSRSRGRSGRRGSKVRTGGTARDGARGWGFAGFQPSMAPKVVFFRSKVESEVLKESVSGDWLHLSVCAGRKICLKPPAGVLMARPVQTSQV